MPTFCPSCGDELYSHPEDETVYQSESCDSCEEDYTEPDPWGEDEDSAGTSSLSSSEATVIAQGIPANPDILPYFNTHRLVSCEWEAVYGIRNADAVLSRMENPPPFERHGDVTCDGEIVFSCLNLRSRTEAKAYGRALEAIRILRSRGYAGVGTRAGHHIHVSAQGTNGYLSPNSLVSLVAVYSHCEDLLYRLASAGWREHRTESGDDYANRMPGIPEKSPRTIGNALAGNRYFGLNVSNYLSSIANCRCGAYRFGEWSACSCSLHQPTIEFRLWNSAIAPRKIRSYIGLSLALVEYAATHADGSHAQLVENPFQGTHRVDEDSLSAQWDFLYGLPTLTYRDRCDLEYLRDRSPGMGTLAHGIPLALNTADERGE